MFKHAFVRGIQSALINTGAASFPDEGTASKVADFIADRVDIDPSTGVSYQDTYKIAGEIVEASDWMKAQPGFKAASFIKVSSWDDVAKLADYHAVALMEKAAEGSTIEGGDKGNDEPSSAEGKMDAAQRPMGYAEGARGQTAVDVRPGAVGAEMPSTNPPSESPMGENSATMQSRTASVAALFRKAAEGSTILGGDKGNDEPTSAEGKMDAAQRPMGYATDSLGQSAVDVRPGAVGKELAHPNGPAQSVSGSNSVTEASKAASADPFIALFKKTANEVVPYLPEELPEDVKVAAVRACMGMTQDEKAQYLGQLQYETKQASAREIVAAAGRRYDGRTANQRKLAEDDKLPAFLAEKLEKKDEAKAKGDDEDMAKGDDEEKDEEGEKKEAAIRANVKRIAASLRR